jgi:hypothetical protein
VENLTTHCTTPNNGNISSDPLLDANHRLPCGSPCLNTGDKVVLLFNDIYDLNQDGVTFQIPADLDLNPRVIVTVDMGAYETILEHFCSTEPADIAPLPCTDGVVNVSDLLAVINGWGNCPLAPQACPPDITSYGIVNVSDLLSVINNWSFPNDPGCPNATGDIETIPSEVTDCMNLCANEEDYGACVQKCLCAIGYEGCE